MRKRYWKLLAATLLLLALVLQAVPALALSERDTATRDYVAGGERAELFNDDWKFYFERTANATEEPTLDASSADFDDSAWEDVDVPHDWQIHRLGAVSTESNTSAMYANGAGWYRKTFYMAPEDEGKNITLRFDGVYMDVNVYINGELITLNPDDQDRTWAYGYSAFHLDLTEYLNYGNTPNVIAVRCRYQTSNSRWYSGAGIYRNVWMITTDPVHVVPDGTYIYTIDENNEEDRPMPTGDMVMTTEVVNTSGADVTDVSVVQQVLDPNGDVVVTATGTIESILAGKTKTIKQEMRVTDPILWDIDDPNVYTVRTTVTADGSTDEYLTKFGFRSILATAKDGFFLNGNRVTFQGVCQHHDLGALGAAVNYRAVERQLEILKEMGVNAVRTAHNPPTPELLEICDRIGLMVVTESFDCWSAAKNPYDYARFFDNWSAMDIASWVRSNRNHPSVIMWSLGNEVGSAHTDGQAVDRAQRLHDLVREHDPMMNALTTYSTNAPETGAQFDDTGKMIAVGPPPPNRRRGSGRVRLQLSGYRDAYRELHQVARQIRGNADFRWRDLFGGAQPRHIYAAGHLCVQHHGQHEIPVLRL